MKSLMFILDSSSIALYIPAHTLSLHDAILILPEEEVPTYETPTTEGSFWATRNGDHMDTLIDRPTTGGTILEV